MVWIACLAPVLVMLLFLYDTHRRELLTRRLGELPVIGRVMATASPGRRGLKAALAALGIALVLLALARPQIAGKRRVEVRGLDLVVAVDVSKSMLVDDVEATAAMTEHGVPASRLGRARELATDILDELPGDRVAPIVFAGAASHFPLTEDRGVAASFLYDLGPADLPPGSNTAEVFRVARCLLRPDLYDDLGCARIGRRGHGGDPLPGDKPEPKASARDDDDGLDTKEERGKAILVLTDGGDSDAETLREVAAAHELGIAVFVVGVGSAKGGVVREIDASGHATAVVKKTRDGADVVSKRDDAGMTAIAAAAGDDHRYFIASERGEVDDDVAPIVAALHAAEHGMATKQIDSRREIFQPVLFLGLMLLVIEAAVSTRRRRSYPEAAA
jgi:Ca-activated chloride channel family protein